ncbi:MAG: YfiR family protein [Massilia sp.]
MGPRRLFHPLRWIALCLWLSAAAASAQPGATEGQLKAAYLYRFAGFIEWPEGAFARPDSPLLIGVAGNDELAAQAGQLVAGRSINGHPLAVRRVRGGDSLAGLHILYIGALDHATLAELLGAARSEALLTVTDSDHGGALGGMIRFVVAQQRLRFEVALAQVQPSRLRISARMLAAAASVSGAP